MQRVPDSSAADGDRAVKKRNLSARTPPQAATGALAVAEDPHSDVADASVDTQQLDHNVRRSTRPRTQRQKRELFHSVRVLGGSAALPDAFGNEAKNRAVWGYIGICPFDRRPYWDKRLKDEAAEAKKDAKSAAKKSAPEGVRGIFESFFGTESEADKQKQRKSHRVRATTVFTKFGGGVTSTEAEAAAKEIASEEGRAAAAAEKRQARANAN